ncbi:MAG TPA: GEVED domain-containing protein, partial [Flavobacteriales bacterium]|nr:GEVED domain-containing protein [Flavobacteriales bacterium]
MKATCSALPGTPGYSNVCIVSPVSGTYAVYNGVSHAQGFEAWVNKCNVTDVPSANWYNTPSTGNTSWRRNDQGTSGAWGGTSGAYSPTFSTGAYSARFHTYNATSGTQGSLDLYIDMSAAAGNSEIKFDQINPSGTDVLAVFISTNGGASFTQLGANLGVATAWTPRMFTMTTNSATTVVRLRGTSDYGNDDIGVDNFRIEAPPSCAVPSALTATAVTTLGADLGWTENGTATAWDLEIGVTGFTPTGTPTNSTGTNPYTWAGGSPNTTYQFYVRADCGGPGTSAWTGPFSFFTGYCTPTVTYTSDYISNFSTTLGITNITNASGGASPGNYGNFTAMAVSAAAGTSFDFSTTYVGGGNGVRIWVDWNNNLTFEAGESAFYLWNANATKTGTITVPPGTPLGNYRMRLRSQYGYTTVDPPPCGSVNYGETEDYTMTVLAPPACLPPSALSAINATTTGADLGWTENGTATAWDLEIGIFGFAPTGTPTNAVGTNPYTWAGGVAATTYDFYVRADCGGSGTSAWAGPFSFTTTCVPFSIPFSEGFESTTGAALPTCWSKEDVNGGTTWNSAAYTGFGSTRAMKYGYDGSLPGDDWVYSPGLVLTGGTSYTVEYRIYDSSVSFPEAMDVFWGSSASAGSMTNLIADHTPLPTTVTTVSYPFTPGTSGTYYIGWHSKSAANEFDFWLDDVSVIVTPACPDPSALSATSLTSSGANLGWTENGSATAWDLEIGTTGFTPSGTPTDNAGTNPYTWAAGTPNTGYEFYVRADCGMDLSAWVGPYGFTTLAVPPANDNCGGAYGLTVNPDLACGSVTAGTIAAATASPESAAACSGTEDDDVWFSFVATATSHAISIINITGSTTDLYHSVWEGGCGSLTLVPGTCSDPNSSTPSGLSIGNTYFLRVYSWTSTPGQTSSFDVCIGTPPPPPANDLCANAIPVGANSVTPGTTVLGTTTGNPGFCDYSLSTAPGVWYTVQGINGMMTADVCGAGWDTRIGIFTGSCGALTCLQGDDDGCGLQSTTTWLGLIGTTYYIYVTGYSTNTGTFNLTLSSVPGNSVVVAINTDASPSEIGWELTDASNITIATGGPSAISGLDQQTVLLDALPASACYGFTLTDSYGDGIIGGNWQLKTMDGKVLVGDDFDGGGNSPSLTPAYAPYTEHTFCLPPGPANIANKSCGILNFSMNSYVYCRNVAGAGNYQFEFSNPDAGYIRRIAVNTNKVRFNQMNTSPLTPGVKYFVRVRTNDAGPLASAHFGAGCEVAISSTVPCTELISAPTYGHSCDEERAFNTNNSFIYAMPVVGATEYQFRLTIPSEGYDETFIRSTYILQLKWNNHPPMVNGSTYNVQVNVKVGATYSGFCGQT